MDPSSPQGDAKEPQQLTPRHYDTVGIGPVFLSAEGTEVRGTIKASPEDFIVREICKHHATGDLLVADLEKAEEIGALLCDNVDPSVDVKPDHKGKKRSLEESEKEDLMKQEIPAPQSTDPLDRLRLALQVVDPDQSFLTSSDGDPSLTLGAFATTQSSNLFDHCGNPLEDRRDPKKYARRSCSACWYFRA